MVEFFVPLLFNGTIHKAVAEAKMKLSRSIVAAVVVFFVLLSADLSIAITGGV